MKTIVIEGSKIKSYEDLLEEFRVKITNAKKGKFSTNGHALYDYLRGGFGVFDYMEEITIEWRNFRQSRNKAGRGSTDSIIGMMEDHEHIILKKIG